MAITKEEALRYLDRQGFVIRDHATLPCAEYSLQGWDKLYGLHFMKSPEMGQMGLISKKSGAGKYFWKPRIRQLFSGLEVSAGDGNSMIVRSEKPIFTEPAPRDAEGLDLLRSDPQNHYFEIHLLNTDR